MTPDGERSPWSAGSDAVFASPPTSPVGSSNVEVDSLPRQRFGQRRAALLLMVMAAFVVVVTVGRAFLVVDLTGVIGAGRSNAVDPGGTGVVAVEATELSGSLVPEPFAGADPRRLPEQLDRRWRTDLAGVSASGPTQLSVVDDGDVVGVFDDDVLQDGREGSLIVLLAGEDGSERWRTSFDGQAHYLAVLGQLGHMIVLEATDVGTLFGVSADTGRVRWVRDADDPGMNVVLEGTRLIARVSRANDRVTVIDPTSGDEAGRMGGRLFATDHLGTWYVRNGAAVSRLDLRDGWKPPTPFEELWVDDDEPASVVGERLIVIDDGSLEVRGDDRSPTGVATIGAAGSGGFAGLDTGANFSQLSSMVDDSFVVVGSRSVFGAELDENGDADVRWRASGTPIEIRPTDRGLSLLVATEGGSSQRVVDASTGREIAAVETVTGAIDSLQLVGNGVVIEQAAGLGSERVGLDLDGNRLWSLVGDGPMVIGAGVVVTYGPSDSGVAITAYGDNS